MHMPQTCTPRQYSIQIKDAKGAIEFSAVALWDEDDKRLALAHFTRLAQLPVVNFYTGPAPEPQFGDGERRPEPGAGRLRRGPS
jgi:hypothetical protein